MERFTTRIALFINSTIEKANKPFRFIGFYSFVVNVSKAKHPQFHKYVTSHVSDHTVRVYVLKITYNEGITNNKTNTCNRQKGLIIGRFYLYIVIHKYHSGTRSS